MKLLCFNGAICLMLLCLVALIAYLEVDVYFTILPMRFGIGPRFVVVQIFHLVMIGMLVGMSIFWYRQNSFANQVFIWLVMAGAVVMLFFFVLLIYQNPHPEQ